MKEEVLITGSTGFIGNALINKFKKNNKKYSIFDRNKLSFSDTKNVQKIVKRKKFIVHLAGKTKGSNLEVFDANTNPTLNLLESISTIKGSKPVFVFASSFAVYKEGRRTLSESSEVCPRNMYGLSKLFSEEMIKYYSKNYNIPCVILRLSNVYGSGIDPFTHSVIATFIYQAKNNLPITINSDGTQTRDFVFVDDVVSAIEKVLNKKWKEGKTEIINICSSDKISLKDVVKIIQRITKNKLKVEYNRNFKEKGYWIGNNQKSKKILDWRPKTAFTKALQKMI